MKKHQPRMLLVIHSLVIVFLLPSISYAQPEFVWSKTFGGDKVDVAESVIQTLSGDFVFVNIGNLIKLDSHGDRIWAVTMGGTGNSVIETIDGGYAVTGTASGNSGNVNLMIAKFDSSGNRIWQTVRDVRDDEVGYDIIQGSDGEFVITGRSHPYHSFTQSVLVAGFSVNGGLLWKKEIPGGLIDRGESLERLADDNIILTGSFVSNIDDAGDILLLKLGANGDVLWRKTYGSGSWDAGKKVIETSDGNLLVVGNIYSFDSGSDDLWVIKTDSSGDSLWSKTIGGPSNESAYSVIESDIGGYIVVGDSGVGPHHEGGGDLWLLKFSEDGDLLWSATYGGEGNDGGRSIQKTSDGGFVVSGFESESDSVNSDAWLIRFPPETKVGIPNDGSLAPLYFSLSQNYPNPFNPVTTIEYSLPKSGDVSLIIYNITGREVIRLLNEKQFEGTHTVRWDASNVASGIYFYRLQAGDFVRTRKMVLLK